jgi:hypothetical protein
VVSVSSSESCCDKLHTDDTALACVLSVETVDHVTNRIMKRGKAVGCDNLTLEHFIYSHPSVVWHLCRLLNLMLKHGYVPNPFGHGIIILLAI